MHSHAYTRQGTYFSFPLCALAYGQTVPQRLNAIICFGMVDAGRKLWPRIPESQRAALWATWTERGESPKGFNSRDPLHVGLLCGASIIGVTVGSVRGSLADYHSLRQFREAFESRHGTDPVVRIKRELLFEARDGKGITPRELTVLAAIYSVIGCKAGPVLITRERIRRRVLGYKTRAVFEAEFSQRLDGAQPLTEWELRSEVDRLHERGFFKRITYGQRQTYYSHRMTATEFQMALIDLKTHRFGFRRLRRLDDEALTDTIRNQRVAMLGKPPPVPNAAPLSLRPGITPEDTP
jgi:hypothetical protein